MRGSTSTLVILVEEVKIHTKLCGLMGSYVMGYCVNKIYCERMRLYRVNTKEMKIQARTDYNDKEQGRPA